jgi:hypothetical protein
MSRPEAFTFALSRDGQHLALGDGPEVLTYRRDGEPAWKAFLNDIIVGVGYVGATLGVCEAGGLVTFFSAPDGRKLEEVVVDGVCIGVCTSPDGAFAVLTTEGLVFVEPNGSQRALPLQDLAAASFGPDRNSVGLLDRHGTFTAMDANSGAPWGSIGTGLPSADAMVAWCYQGFWCVSAETALLRIDGGATQLLGRSDVPLPTRALALSEDGAIAALVSEQGTVSLVEMHGHQHVGDVVFRRTVQGIGFGRGALLGVGFDDGDANTVDLLTRATVRTEPHPGRGRNNWNLEMQFDAAPIRGAVTYLRAGGAPIAEFHGFVEPGYEEGGGSRNTGCKIALLITFLFFLGLTGCLTFLFVLRFMGFL